MLCGFRKPLKLYIGLCEWSVGVFRWERGRYSCHCAQQGTRPPPPKATGGRLGEGTGMGGRARAWPSPATAQLCCLGFLLWKMKVVKPTLQGCKNVNSIHKGLCRHITKAQ